VACALVLSFSLRARILPEARTLHIASETVAALTRARLLPTDERPLWVVGYRDPSLVFLTRTSTRSVSAREAGERAQAGDAVAVETRALQELDAVLAERDLMFTPAEPPVRGLSLGLGERVALFVGEVDELSGEAVDGRQSGP